VFAVPLLSMRHQIYSSDLPHTIILPPAYAFHFLSLDGADVLIKLRVSGTNNGMPFLIITPRRDMKVILHGLYTSVLDGIR
jgi:hypothetical protein